MVKTYREFPGDTFVLDQTLSDVRPSSFQRTEEVEKRGRFRARRLVEERLRYSDSENILISRC